MNRSFQTIFEPIPQKSQRVAFTNTARSSAALETHCKAVQLVATQDCRIEFNTGGAAEGTADATGSTASNVTTSISAFIKAGLLYTFLVPTAAAATVISVIRDGANDGNLDITQLT